MTLSPRPVQLITSILIFAVTALTTAFFAVHGAGVSEREALISQMDGERLVAFRLSADAFSAISLGQANVPFWTRQDLADLDLFNSIEELAWSGKFNRTHDARLPYALASVIVSPNYLQLLGKSLWIGRPLALSDADKPRIVVSEELAKALFPSVPLAETINNILQVRSAPHEIVGIYEGDGPVYLTRSTPDMIVAGRDDINDVFVRIRPGTSIGSFVDKLNVWLRERDNIAGLEAVPFREFTRSDITLMRTPFLREVTLLANGLLVLFLVVSTLNLSGPALLTVLERSDYLALRRLVGATRVDLLKEQLTAAIRAALPPIATGALVGVSLSTFRGGALSIAPLLLGAVCGLSSTFVGTLIGIRSTFHLQPTAILSKGRGGLLRPIGNPIGLGAMFVALAASIVAGGFIESGLRSLKAERQFLGTARIEIVSGLSWTDPRPRASVGSGDMDALARTFPNLVIALIGQNLGHVQSAAERVEDVTIQTTHGDYAEISNTTLVAGRWPDPDESAVVLGQQLAKTLFGEQNPVGEQLRVAFPWETYTVTVAAVAQQPDTANPESLQLRSDQMQMSMQPYGLFLPFTRLHVAWTGSGTDLDAVVSLLNDRHPTAAPFATRSPIAQLERNLLFLTNETTRLVLTTVLIIGVAVFGSITFLYADTVSRRQQHALHRALGASTRNILNMHLRSNLVMTFGVWIGGTIVGLSVWMLWIDRLLYEVKVYPVWWVIAALGLMLGLGWSFGRKTSAWSEAGSPLALLRDE